MAFIHSCFVCISVSDSSRFHTSIDPFSIPVSWRVCASVPVWVPQPYTQDTKIYFTVCVYIYTYSSGQSNMIVECMNISKLLLRKMDESEREREWKQITATNRQTKKQYNTVLMTVQIETHRHRHTLSPTTWSELINMEAS